MKNLKTLTLILFAASTLFATSCQKETTTVNDSNTSNELQEQKEQIIGSWSLTKLSYVDYDATTNKMTNEAEIKHYDTWTFDDAMMNGTIFGETTLLSWSIPAINTLRLDSEDYEIMNLTAKSFQLRNTEYANGDKEVTTYYFTKK
jgi:hypothetical protein